MLHFFGLYDPYIIISSQDYNSLIDVVFDIIATIGTNFIETPIRLLFLLVIICWILCVILIIIESIRMIFHNYVGNNVYCEYECIDDDDYCDYSNCDPNYLGFEVAAAMDHTSPAVRDAALSMVKSGHSGDYNINQVCDIFDYCYDHWVYVDGPYNEECFTPAKDLVSCMRGDICDLAIMMASLVQAIGGVARVVFALGADGQCDHVYTEVYLGTGINCLNRHIKSISRRYDGVSVHYSTSTNSSGYKEYWLNLDCRGKHVGGEFYESIGTCQIIYSSGRCETSDWVHGM